MKKFIILVLVGMFSGAFAQGTVTQEGEDSSSQMSIDMPAAAPKKVLNTKTLYDFETEAELKDFAFKNCTATLNDQVNFVKSGKKSLQLEFSGEADWPGMYSGVHDQTTTPIKKDWSGDYNTLRMDIYNTLNERVNISCRIDDEKSSNYKTRFNLDDISLKPGWNTVAIDFLYLRYGEGKAKSGRKIDIKNLRLFSLYSANKKELILYVDNIRLDKLAEDK